MPALKLDGPSGVQKLVSKVGQKETVPAIPTVPDESAAVVALAWR
jgi:hypothetical protein